MSTLFAAPCALFSTGTMFFAMALAGPLRHCWYCCAQLSGVAEGTGAVAMLALAAGGAFVPPAPGCD